MNIWWKHMIPWCLFRKSGAILLDMGADINSPDIVGWTPLMWAAKAGNVGVVELLLERGGHTDHVDIDGNSALHVAAHFGQVEIVRTLLNYGGSLILQNKRGMTCLDVAMEAQINEVVMVIVKHNRYFTASIPLLVSSNAIWNELCNISWGMCACAPFQAS